MKRCFVILFSLFTSISLLAQEETLIDDGFHSGGYGGPVWKIGWVNGHLGLFSGGRGGWIINHTFVLGGGGYSQLLDVKTDQFSTEGKPLYLNVGYGGFEMEYIHESDKLIHWTVHAMIGSGYAKLKEHNPNEAVKTDNIYMFEPSFNVDVNVSQWFRIGLGLSYRLAMDVDLPGITSSDVGGPSGLVILKFGSF